MRAGSELDAPRETAIAPAPQAYEGSRALSKNTAAGEGLRHRESGRLLDRLGLNPFQKGIMLWTGLAI